MPGFNRGFHHSSTCKAWIGDRVECVGTMFVTGGGQVARWNTAGFPFVWWMGPRVIASRALSTFPSRLGARIGGRRQAKLARSCRCKSGPVRPSEPPGSECCVRRRRRRTRSVHSGCVGCVIEPRNDETAGAEAVTYGRTQHVQCRYARYCRPAGVEEHITRKWIVSEPGIPLVWPLLFASAVRIGKVRSRSRWCTDMGSRTPP
jgi:hypothetical protein